MGLTRCLDIGKLDEERLKGFFFTFVYAIQN